MTKWKVDHLGSIFLKIKKRSLIWYIFDHFSWTSSENSDVESFCPHDGHLPP
jgi:hypothetical protein